MRRSMILLAALAVLAGCSKTSSGPSEVAVKVTDDGFTPKVVTVEKGRPATLVITRVVDATCATEAVFAATGKKYPLPLNVPVRIPLETANADTLRYACGMDMYHAQVIVK